MDARIQGLWADRLESGTVPQAHGRLGDSTGARCCLGVLCDIAVEEGVIQSYVDDLGHMRYSGDGSLPADEWEGGVLPSAVRVWAGLNSNNPSLPGITFGTRNLSCAEVNDGIKEDGSPDVYLSDPRDFREIAALVRTL
jgi:hypothetical protein